MENFTVAIRVNGVTEPIVSSGLSQHSALQIADKTIETGIRVPLKGPLQMQVTFPASQIMAVWTYKTLTPQDDQT